MFYRRIHPRLRWSREPRPVQTPVLEYETPAAGPVDPQPRWWNGWVMDFVVHLVIEPLAMIGIALVALWWTFG